MTDYPHAYDGLSNRALLVEANRKLDILIGGEIAILRKENYIMATEADVLAQSNDLIAKVTNLTTVDTALAAYVQGIKDQQTALAQQLADALANGASQDDLTAISSNMTAAATAIDAAAASDAVLAGTPPA